MKAQKGFLTVPRNLITGSFILLCLSAGGQSVVVGKNLDQLRKLVFPDNHPAFMLLSNERQLSVKPRLALVHPQFTPGYLPLAASEMPASPFLPRWTAECLPFFCRIEHDFAQKSAIPFKFRLGSVDYVDWLEGKSDLQALPPR